MVNVAGYDITIVSDRPDVIACLEYVFEKHNSDIEKRFKDEVRKLMLYGYSDIKCLKVEE